MWQRSLGFVCFVLALGFFGWWLFGSSSTHQEGLGDVSYQRFFGRVVQVKLDVNKDAQPDSIAYYTWRKPFKEGGIFKPCGDSGMYLIKEDRDFNGQWDTWVTNDGADEAGVCLLKFAADTNGDGEEDFAITVKRFEATYAYMQIRNKRGF